MTNLRRRLHRLFIRPESERGKPFMIKPWQFDVYLVVLMAVGFVLGLLW